MIEPSNLEYKHLALYANTGIKVTLISPHASCKEAVYIHNQRIDNISFFHGFEEFHSEPYSFSGFSNRYYLELYPIETVQYNNGLINEYFFDDVGLVEVRNLLLGTITADRLSYSTVRALLKHHIDFLGFIKADIALDKSLIDQKTTTIAY